MSVVVLGESGQVASHLKELLPGAVYKGRAALDLAVPVEIVPALEALAPSLIVNAAAYTAVDKAEAESDLAWRINAEAVAMVARAAAALDVPVVHISTDYVFDGRKSAAYRVEDSMRPINIYGSTKLGGELALRTLWRKHWILRTSWVFSEYGANFVKTMLRLGATTDTLKVVSDQRGCPTYAGDIARLVAALVSSEARERTLPYGTYHAAGGPAVSWHGFAEAIVALGHERDLLPRRPAVCPITTREYPTPARRPANAVLEPSSELESALGVRLDWQKGLERALKQIKAHQR